MQKLYQKDFHAWANQQVALLRAGRFAELDICHLIEEIEDVGKRERRAIVSQLSRLILHLLKWQYQPHRRSDSWRDSIDDARYQIELALEESPSLKNSPVEYVALCHQRARRAAAQQSGIPLEHLPVDCPYTLEQLLDSDWLPVERGPY